jgi:pimeloyl-ACP methyl ester carboxylesterase
MLTMWRSLLLIAIFITTGVGTSTAGAPKLLSDPNRVSDANRALVLIHGLLGSPATSFGDWPTIISKDNSDLPGYGKLSDFAVYAVDYEADFESRTKLEDVAVGVSRDLAASQIFKRHRHVWLVAHSMGGLVLKRTLVLWKLEQRDLLLDRLMAIGMLGVPSAGAPLADLSEKYRVGRIATTFGWNGELLKDLTTNGGSYLDSLETGWLAIIVARNRSPQRRYTPFISCGFEGKPEIDKWWGRVIFDSMFGNNISTIVPKIFTSSACDAWRSFSVKHTELIKPKNEDVSTHVWLRDLIERSIAEGYKEERVELTTRQPQPQPSDVVDFNLADRMGRWNDELEAGNLDPVTRLAAHPERIAFEDDSEGIARKLVLRGGPFKGNTKVDVLAKAAKENKCLEMIVTPNRLLVTLRVNKTKLAQCAGGASVCEGQRCD